MLGYNNRHQALGENVITKDEFRNSMARFATGVTVVTTIDDQGNFHGMTANSFTSVCLDPPLILVCVDLHANTHQFVQDRGRFGINILSDHQKEIGAYFARRPEDRHGEVKYKHRQSEHGLRFIEGALAFLSCYVVDSRLYGDHTVFVGQVDEIMPGEDSGKPLIYYERRFTSLGPEQNTIS